jgi:hypothetical protein
MDESPNNSFDAINRVHCFCHTLNLSVKAFLRPFDPPEKKKRGGGGDDSAPNMGTRGGDDDDEDDLDLMIEVEDNKDMPDLANVSDTDASESPDDEDTSVWDDLALSERLALLDETSAVKSVISRVIIPVIS